MASSEATVTRHTGVVVRILGVLLAAWGLLNLLGFIGLALDHPGEFATYFMPREVIALFGYWFISGVWAHLHEALTSTLFLIAGIQLARLRRGGWILAVSLLALAALSCVVFEIAGGTKSYVMRFIEEWGDSAPPNQFFSTEVPVNVIRIDRLVWWTFILWVTPLIYLLSERRRFFGEYEACSRRMQFAKVTTCLLVIGAAALWTFWAADYRTYQSVLLEAQSSSPDISRDAWEMLLPRQKREVSALLIRRLVEEETEALADAVSGLMVAHRLELLSPDDIRGIIEASRHKNVNVRMACYSLLGRIGTAESIERLRGVVANTDHLDSHSEWNRALSALGTQPVRLTKAPDTLFTILKTDEYNRTTAIRHLREFRDERTLPALLKFAIDEDAKVRSKVMSTLGSHPSRESEDVLLRALGDEQGEIRSGACYSLSRIGTGRAVPRLIEFMRNRGKGLADKDKTKASQLGDDARLALSRITGGQYEWNASEWEAWWAENSQDFGIRISLRERLFTPMPSEPARPARTHGESRREPYKSYIAAVCRKTEAIRGIHSRELRDMAPDLVRYLRLPEKEAPFQFMAAEALADWGYREGIEFFIGQLEGIGDNPNLPGATTVLGRATGVNFFADKKRGDDWWQKNQHRFPSASDSGVD